MSLTRSTSMDQLKDLGRPSIGILSFDASTGVWEKDIGLEESITGAIGRLLLSMDGSTEERARSRASVSSLYSLENLRKRGQEE